MILQMVEDKRIIDQKAHVRRGDSMPLFLKNTIYSQTCVQRPPLGPEKSGRCSEVVVIQRVKM
jgi:hypothetical protein